MEEDDTLILSRKMADTGKSSVKINGVSATVSMLKRLTGFLVDVHGQSEHFALLDERNQLDLIDKFGGEDIKAIKNKVKLCYEQLKELKKELLSNGGDEKDRIIKMDILNFQINEIQNAEVKEREYEELTELKTKLLNREKIINALSAVKNCISEEGGALDVISNAVRAINVISDINPKYENVSERLNSVYSELDDISDSVTELSDDFEDDGFSLEEVEDRLYKIKNLFKKYGGDYLSLVEFLNNATVELEKIHNFSEYYEKLNSEINDKKTELFGLYKELSAKRKIVSENFSSAIIKEIVELGMNKASFTVNFSEFPSFETCKFDSANGVDDIIFMFSANLGEPVKPLSEIISGGEISRFMLAVKSQTAKYNEISTFIFDEIDAGISGVIARVVAEKFATISKNVQIIAISHLAQITSFADRNILIYKTEVEGKTFTNVKTLNEDERVLEITRLIGGNENDFSAKEHAKSLINFAKSFKLSL